MRACTSRYLFSSDMNGLSFTTTSRDEPATNGRLMWYTSVWTSLFSPLELIMCSHLLVSDSSALHINRGSHEGACIIHCLVSQGANPVLLILLEFSSNTFKEKLWLDLAYILYIFPPFWWDDQVKALQWCTGCSLSRHWRSKYIGLYIWHSASVSALHLNRS